jgi:hypothetical protein
MRLQAILSPQAGEAKKSRVPCQRMIRALVDT